MQHLAASRGYEDITLFLIQEGVDINQKGNSETRKYYKAKSLCFGHILAQINLGIHHC